MSFKRFINFCRELSKHNSWFAIKIPYFTELQVVETIKIWLVYLCFTRKKVKCTKLLHRCGKAMVSPGKLMNIVYKWWIFHIELLRIPTAVAASTPSTTWKAART